MLSLASQILDGEFNILRKTFLLMDNTQGRISRGLTPPPQNFHIFLKSEEKEGKGMGGGVSVNIFFGVEIFSGGGGGGVEKSMFGRLRFFGGLLGFLREGSRFLGCV